MLLPFISEAKGSREMRDQQKRQEKIIPKAYRSGQVTECNDLPDDYQPDRMGIPHNHEKVRLRIFVKRTDTPVNTFRKFNFNKCVQRRLKFRLNTHQH